MSPRACQGLRGPACLLGSPRHVSGADSRGHLGLSSSLLDFLRTPVIQTKSFHPCAGSWLGLRKVSLHKHLVVVSGAEGVSHP